jgi:glycosyltransferase involved in cell wall biosynthesis
MDRFVLPRTSIGWAGGDQYIDTTELMFDFLDKKGHIKFIRGLSRFEDSIFDLLGKQFGEKFKHLYWSKKGINFPWSFSRFGNSPLHWIPDLQHLEMPGFFSESEINTRNSNMDHQIRKGKLLIFSSKNAESIFHSKYNYERTAVLRFAFPAQRPDVESFRQDCSTCNEGNYFYLPNQWWKHKNHVNGLRAFKEYRNSGGKLHLVMSGGRSDPRDPNHELIVKSELEGTNLFIHDMGFVQRSIQLSLLEKCAAVLQPSLYEGWSTPIEEAFTFRKQLLASNIPSILEQTSGYSDACLFDPNSKESIREAMDFVEKGTRDKVKDVDIELRWNRYSDDFLNILEILSL